MKIATAGSCFAQHITSAVKQAGCQFVDREPAPVGLARENWPKFGYGLYSARYGNVYTTRQLWQLLQRAGGAFVPQTTAWAHRGGFVDPFRPVIEPEPFETVEELERSRRLHLERVATVFETADLFVFTLGLTEMWCAAGDGAAFPLAPGVAGGRYDPAEHRFVNLTFGEVVDDMERFFAAARAINPRLHFILTVSPVPLAATATDAPVVVASSHSKAILRAACGQLSAGHDNVDYFPSYEMVASHVMRGIFFEPDGRRVTEEGVDHVMNQFFAAHGLTRAEAVACPASRLLDPACEEELLAAAARRC